MRMNLILICRIYSTRSGDRLKSWSCECLTRKVHLEWCEFNEPFPRWSCNRSKWTSLKLPCIISSFIACDMISSDSNWLKVSGVSAMCNISVVDGSWRKPNHRTFRWWIVITIALKCISISPSSIQKRDAKSVSGSRSLVRQAAKFSKNRERNWRLQPIRRNRDDSTVWK
jgi:hypothetical protein